MRTIKIDGVEIPEDKIREAYEQMQRESKSPRLVKGAVMRVLDDVERGTVVRLNDYVPHSDLSYKTKVNDWRYGAPLDWETIGRTCAPPDAEWFAREGAGSLIWGKGTKSTPVAGGWIGDICKDSDGNIYRVYTHEPADDWKESFRRIERI